MKSSNGTQRSLVAQTIVALLAVGGLIAAVGCQDADSDDTRSETGLDSDEERIAASPETEQELGIQSWVVRKGATDLDAVVDAVGDHNTKLAELRLRSNDSPIGGVRVTSATENEGEVVIAENGIVSGSGADRLVELGEALSNDLEAGEVLDVGQDLAGDSEGVATAKQGLSANPSSEMWDRRIAFEADESNGRTLGGVRREKTVGGQCLDGFTRTAYEIKKISGDPNCYIRGWASQDPYDCRVLLHYGQKVLKKGRCHWTIYQWGYHN